MPTDYELAAAAERLTSASAYAVALAVRAIVADGERPTVEAVMDLTGLGRSTVYDARARLRELWPDEYPPGPATGADSTIPDPTDSTIPDRPASRTPALLAGKVALVDGTAVVARTNGHDAPPPWRIALATVGQDLPGRRSWNLYDRHSAAWDLVLEMIPEPEDPTPNLIALAVDFLARAIGADPDRGQVAKLVRLYGKAALFGLNKAVGVTETDTTRDLYRYARAVAERIVADLDHATLEDA